MYAIILNESFESIYLLDSFESFIWTDRYNKCGDFELYLPATKELLDILKPDYYVWSSVSDRLMIIENVRVQSDIEDGNHLTVSGRSLESILYRRIVWDQTNINGNFQNGIKTLINNAIISPSISSRRIDNFVFSNSSDTRITSLSLEGQYTGDNLYNVVSEACLKEKIGFKVILNSSNNFVFSLYSSEDRSYSQNTNPFVVFSPNFENIINSDYKDLREEYRNVTLIAGEGEGSERKTSVIGSVSGLKRRELFTDARDISSTTDDGELTPEEYTAKLNERGTTELDNYKIDQTFEGKTETTQMFVYGTDFFLGDVVQLENEYGMSSKSRITEIIFSYDKDGFAVYPTFEIEEDEEE